MDSSIKLRVILDAKEDVFRDIEIKPEQSLEDLHHCIVRVFGLQKGEMASFYKSDTEWNQGDEIPFMDMGLGDAPLTMMREIKVSDAFSKNNKHMLFVYDFFNMWTFFAEFITMIEIEKDDDYPRCTYNFGDTPEEAPTKDFSGKSQGRSDIFGDAFDDEDGEDHHFGEEDEGFFN